MDRKNIMKIVFLAISAFGLYYVITRYSKKSVEGFEGHEEKCPEGEIRNEEGKCVQKDAFNQCADDEVFDEQTQQCKKAENFTGGYSVQPAQAFGSSETYFSLENGNSAVAPNQFPKDCFPKDQLTPGELLPGDSSSKWAQSVPNNQGELGDQNFLTAGYHIGVNTVGQTLRNANRQLRSEPPNPQMKVSPWLQTTIEPDINRRPLEIGGCA
jgi:hypothetical protein